MSVKKDLAFEKLMRDFEKFSNLTLLQLDLLDKMISDYVAKKPVDGFKSQIAENETVLNQLEVKVSERIMRIISLYNPMASDLRKLLAIYRMLIDLERIGDLVTGVVRDMLRIKDVEIFVNASDVIDNMLVMTKEMLIKALLSFTQNDRESAIWTIKSDSVVDELNHKLLRKSVAKTNLTDEHQEMIMSFLKLKSIVSDIERIGDHSTNIAEASIYALDGTDLRHVDLDLDD